jgi:1,4-dihydroxy-2-naphthoate octaprenyltransferase
MKNAIALLSLLSFGTGISLIYRAYNVLGNLIWWLFLPLGILSIAAALTYTAGKKPYGYRALGDLSVLVFFGWIGVGGTFVLQTGTLNLSIMLPATTIGLFSVAVLNLNNLRDRFNDGASGKKTIVVILGQEKGVLYHNFLIVFSWILALAYAISQSFEWKGFFFMAMFPLFFLDLKKINAIAEPQDFDPFLKKTALKTFLFSIVFSVCAHL